MKTLLLLAALAFGIAARAQSQSTRDAVAKRYNGQPGFFSGQYGHPDQSNGMWLVVRNGNYIDVRGSSRGVFLTGTCKARMQTTFYLSCGDTLHFAFDGANLIVTSPNYAGQPLVGVFTKSPDMSQRLVGDLQASMDVGILFDKKTVRTLCK